MLTRPHRPPDETPTLPPISVLTTPYAFTPLPLPSLCSRGALPTCSQHQVSLRSWDALPTCSQHHLSLRLCSASKHAPDTTYPYASVLHPQCTVACWGKR
ncbi:hypothetical protein O181_126231 [Austropuccinia psidii MF-1]|uniref:Uncharacterized protein n=1 Tax=Austropuccinia psidii MF-1 TaxID=1389203 RepID=A0A9Q3KTW8_9BASI|nr:hypothetical protein [Austropuccinia psidii MF-1]